jgi:hypothetical protein
MNLRCHKNFKHHLSKSSIHNYYAKSMFGYVNLTMLSSIIVTKNPLVYYLTLFFQGKPFIKLYDLRVSPCNTMMKSTEYHIYIPSTLYFWAYLASMLSP